MSTSVKPEKELSRSLNAPSTRKTPTKRRTTHRKRGASILRGVLIALVAVFFLFPLVWMVTASFKSSIDITSTDSMFSFVPTLQNYTTVFERENFLAFGLNSLLIAMISTALSLVLGVPAAYAIARFSMKKSSIVVLIARVVPGISLLVPWYYIFARVGLVDTYAALILTHMFVGLPLVVWIMITSFESLPVELEEAGQIDGLTRIGTFLRVALPLASPGIATCSILAIIFSWNNFLFALVLSGSNTKTLPVAIFNFISYASIDWGGLMAASVVITLPIMLISMLMQRYVVSGLTGGATKG